MKGLGIGGLAFVLGLVVFAPQGAAGLAVSFETTETLEDIGVARFAPANVVAVWVEDSEGAFVKTIGRWAGVRANYLLTWSQMSGGAGQDTDAVSGATRLNHNGLLQASWDFLDAAGQEVPDGTYTLRMEASDENAVEAANNNLGTFTFVKGEMEEMQGPLTDGGFQNVTLTSEPGAEPPPLVSNEGDENVVTGGCSGNDKSGAAAIFLLLAALGMGRATKKRATQ